jgi:uncharacterized coiled-coil protein SlyX
MTQIWDNKASLLLYSGGDDQSSVSQIDTMEATIASQQAQIDHLNQLAAQATGQSQQQQLSWDSAPRRVQMGTVTDQQRGVPHGYSNDDQHDPVRFMIVNCRRLR